MRQLKLTKEICEVKIDAKNGPLFRRDLDMPTAGHITSTVPCGPCFTVQSIRTPKRQGP